MNIKHILEFDDYDSGRKQLYPKLSDQEYIELILKELENLNKQYDDPNDKICKHCIDLSLSERYKELKKMGHIK